MNTDTSEPRDIYTVTRLNREVRAVLEDSFPPPVWVRGEVSNLARPASGHLYFSLKDRHSQVRCAMFKSANRNLRMRLSLFLDNFTNPTISLTHFLSLRLKIIL